MINATALAAFIAQSCAGQPIGTKVVFDEIPGAVFNCQSVSEMERRRRFIDRLQEEGLGSIPGITVIE